MARDGQVVGSMVLSDRVREDAADTVRQLHDRGYRTVMLTGELSLQGMVHIYGWTLLCLHLRLSGSCGE